MNMPRYFDVSAGRADAVGGISQPPPPVRIVAPLKPCCEIALLFVDAPFAVMFCTVKLFGRRAGILRGRELIIGVVALDRRGTPRPPSASTCRPSW